MSKYEEYRAMAEKIDSVFEADIEGRKKKVRIELNPISDNLWVNIPDFFYGNSEFKIEGRTGEALLKALKQIYE
jgi:hypothetical protein